MNEFEYLINEMKNRIAVLSDALSTNKISSYEEYKYTCGQIRGLEAACFVISDLKKRMEHSDDE